MDLRKIKFTSLAVNSLKCPPGAQQIIYWDNKTPNLGMRVTRTQARSYVFEAWLAGKSLRTTIGDTRTWSISAAQAEARRLKVLVDQGIDPRSEKSELIAAVKAQQLQGTLALDAWDAYVTARADRWSARHTADHQDMVRLGGEQITRGRRAGMSEVKEPGILYALLNRPLNALSRDDVYHWLKREGTRRPTRARLALSLLRAFMNWAADHSQYRTLVQKDACSRLTRELPAPTAKRDCLQKEQLAAWFAAVISIPNRVISAYLQVLLLTGARREELASLKWNDLDLQWHTAVIKDKASKSVVKTRVISIPPYCESLMAGLPRKNEWVFSSASAESGRLQEPRLAHKSAVESAGLPPLTLHGLRRSFGSLAEWIDVPSGVTAQLMGHAPSAIAEKHYRVRPVDLIRKWHVDIEKFILSEAGIEQPVYGLPRIHAVGERG
jgi:integrase